MKLKSIETKKMEYLNNVVCQNINFLLDHYGIKYKDDTLNLMNNNQKKWRYYYYKNLFGININIDSTIYNIYMCEL